MTDTLLNKAPELQNGFRLGGFSGLVAADSTGTSFVTLTDRGPNGDIKVNGSPRQRSRCRSSRLGW